MHCMTSHNMQNTVLLVNGSFAQLHKFSVMSDWIDRERSRNVFSADKRQYLPWDTAFKDTSLQVRIGKNHASQSNMLCECWGRKSCHPEKKTLDVICRQFEKQGAVLQIVLSILEGLKVQWWGRKREGREEGENFTRKAQTPTQSKPQSGKATRQRPNHTFISCLCQFLNEIVKNGFCRVIVYPSPWICSFTNTMTHNPFHK